MADCFSEFWRLAVLDIAFPLINKYYEEDKKKETQKERSFLFVPSIFWVYLYLYRPRLHRLRFRHLRL